VVANAAYGACLRLAREHYENFPVASRLLPRASRPHIAAIYAFARIADDFADEGQRSEAARLALLDDWNDRLREAAAGAPRQDDSDAANVFIALADTMARFDLEPDLFEDLLSAFRQDVRVKRYETWDDLIDYSRRSANPVGRLVLRVAGYRRPELDTWSDHVCTALQLTNFWQDIERDWQKDRVYVPQAEMRAAGAVERDLDQRRWTPAWQEVMRGLAGRTRERFLAGRPVADAVSGRLRWELRATWQGGMRILDRLEAGGFDIFARRPTLGWVDTPVILWRVAVWRGRRRMAAESHR
jgi:phytoene synthase